MEVDNMKTGNERQLCEQFAKLPGAQVSDAWVMLCPANEVNSSRSADADSMRRSVPSGRVPDSLFLPSTSSVKAPPIKPDPQEGGRLDVS